MVYETIDLNMHWKDEASRMSEADENENIPGAGQMAALFISLQAAYEAVCDGMEIPRHNLYVVSIAHPNSLFSLKGLGEPIRALNEIIASFPNLVLELSEIAYIYCETALASENKRSI